MANTGLMITMEPIEPTSFVPTVRGMQERLVDLSGTYDALYSAFRKIEQRRFNKEGPGWAPLAPATVAQREYLGITGSHPILNRTGITYEGRKGGTLRKSLTTKGAKYAVFEPLVDGLFMGTSDPIAIYHQEGTHGAGRDHNVSMPARPVVDMKEEDAATFSSILEEWIMGFRAAESELYSPMSETAQNAVNVA